MPDVIAIIANGTPPETTWERAALAACGACVCCDCLPPSDAPPLLQVVGDMDTCRETLPLELFTDLHVDQETNDLTKAVTWCRARFPEVRLEFFAVTGRREDHTLANLSLISEYGCPTGVFTASGCFDVLMAGAHRLIVQEGFPVSFLSFTPQRITVRGVMWPVENLLLDMLWRATLNRCTSNTLDIRCESPLLVYRPWSLS